jgi:hypothetical protein
LTALKDCEPELSGMDWPAALALSGAAQLKLALKDLVKGGVYTIYDLVPALGGVRGVSRAFSQFGFDLPLNEWRNSEGSYK